MAEHEHDVDPRRSTPPSEVDTESGLPIGPPGADPSPAALPTRVVLEGTYARLEPIDAARHADALFAAASAPGAAARHRYLFDAAPTDAATHRSWLEALATRADPLTFAVVDRRTGRAEGRQALMRITPEHRVIELGSILWGPAIARSAVATEAHYLMLAYAFDTLGYRRFEWKCDALNAPSRRAARRFGYQFEGVFRRHMIGRGRSRDTAWYAIIDEDWPQLRAAYQAWLAPSNFDADGAQRTALATR